MVIPDFAGNFGQAVIGIDLGLPKAEPGLDYSLR
jgi:hypothetical protein